MIKVRVVVMVSSDDKPVITFQDLVTLNPTELTLMKVKIATAARLKVSGTFEKLEQMASEYVAEFVERDNGR